MIKNVTKSNVRNDRYKDNETREREFYIEYPSDTAVPKRVKLFPIYFASYFRRNLSKIFNQYFEIHNQCSIYAYTFSTRTGTRLRVC